MEAVLPVEIEVPLLLALMEAELEEANWVQAQAKQLNFIEEKRMAALRHAQCYQRRIARAYDKKVKPRVFQEGGLVLKMILPFREDPRDKFKPNYEG